MHELDRSALNEIILKRRSVKPNQFIPGKKIPDEVVIQAIHNATWAPTHGRTEPWFFKVFTEGGLRKLADFQSELYRKMSGEKFVEAKYQKLKSDPLLCSHVIAICLKRGENVKIPLQEEIEAVACSVQNIYLTITAYGYGGYWSTGGVTYMEDAKPFFGLRKADMLLGFFSIGEPAIEIIQPVRKAVQQISEWITEN